MMDETPCISTALIDSELVVMMHDELRARDPEKASAADKALNKGQSVSEDACPKRFWRMTNIDDPKDAFDLFDAAGYWIVSERAAEVLRRFDLGGGAIYPITDGLYEEDNETRIPGVYFCWIFGNVKSTFLPDETPRKRPFGVAGVRWNMPTIPKDNDIALSPDARGGADVWIDPKLFQSLFVSGQLAKALALEGLYDAFRLKTCRIIDLC
jgi:hypothetical protein